MLNSSTFIKKSRATIFLRIFSNIFVVGNLLYFISLYFSNRKHLDVVLREDFIFEWATFIFLMLCSGVFSLYLLKFKKNKFYYLFFALGMIVFLFGAFEEVSWFQRVFDFKGTNLIIDNNSQSEFNIHNLVIGGIGLNKLIFGKILGVLIGLYYLIPAITKEISNTGKSIFEGLYIPTPDILDLVTLLITIGTVYLVLDFKKQGEILEYLLSFQLLTLFYREYLKIAPFSNNG